MNYFISGAAAILSALVIVYTLLWAFAMIGTDPVVHHCVPQRVVEELLDQKFECATTLDEARAQSLVLTSHLRACQGVAP